MSETAEDKYSRLSSMLSDDGGTWDLSSNDKAAIKYALGMINVLAEELAGYTGDTVPRVIAEFSAQVEQDN